MTIQIYDDSIYFIQFKNIKLAIDINAFTFLSEIKDNCIKLLNADIKDLLLKKFKIKKLDSFTKNPIHIKFLVKYSPIFSKFIDDEELNKIELEELQRISHNPYYLKFEGKFYFHFLTSNCKNKRIVIPMDKNFKNIKVLKNFFNEVIS